jgi:hypothetical protein
MAIGSPSLSSASGAGITINIDGGAQAATSGATSGSDAIQADIAKLVQDLQKLTESNSTSEGGKSGKTNSAKEHAPGQAKKADKASEQSNKLMEMLGKILEIFAKLLGGGQDAGTDSGTQTGNQGVAEGEPTGSTGGNTVINVNSK